MEEVIRVSLGSAAVLGLKKVAVKSKTKTIFLMNSGGCEFNCSFCTQARDSNSNQDKLSRVTWPEYDLEKVLYALKEKQEEYRRICMQVVNSKGIFYNLPDIVKKIKKSAPDTDIAITIRTQSIKDVDAIFSSGADEVGLSIDVADPKHFASIKGGNFELFKSFVLQVARKYPGKIATHLIVGMGETERQIVKLIEELHEQKVIIALFAFTPVRGAKLEFDQAPNMSHYRRVQIALHLIANDLNKNFTYDKNDSIINFGIAKDELYNVLKNSNVFETSGCKDCNRPYYNERAGDEELYNYPAKINNELFANIFDRLMIYNLG